MATLLVALSVMAILLTVVMPVWRQMVQREKEAELVFRAQQYLNAIKLFQRKHGPGTLPPTVDVLVQERTLRKIIARFKDHPGLGAWKGYDEAAWVKMPVEPVMAAYKIFKEMDPDHPVILIHAPTKVGRRIGSVMRRSVMR